MKQLFNLAENLVMSRLLSNKAPLTHVGKGGILLLFCVGWLVFFTLGFLCLACFLYMQTVFNPVLASLITALVALSVILVLSIAFYVYLKMRQRALARKQEEMRILIQMAQEELGQEAVELTKNNPKTSVLAACISGYALGQQL